MKPWKRPILLVAAACISFAPIRAQEAAPTNLDLMERFVLEKDRKPVLSSLSPGSELSCYLRALDAQMRGDDAAYAAALAAFDGADLEDSPLLAKLRLRQRLIDAPKGPVQLGELAKALGLRTDHPRPFVAGDTHLPTTLPADGLDAESVVRKLLADDAIEELSDDGLALAVNRRLPLTEGQRKHILERIKWMPGDTWTDLVAEEVLASKDWSFGRTGNLTHLLPAQLDALAKRVPGIENHPGFIDRCIDNLKPADLNQWELNPAAEADWLRERWAWLRPMPEYIDNIKEKILLRLLIVENRLGKADKAIFIELLGIQHKPIGWISTEYLPESDETDETGNYYRLRDRILNDLLLRFLGDAASPDEFAPFIDEAILKSLWAQAKLLKGDTDTRRWSAMLPPAILDRLNGRVDLAFADSTPRRWRVEDAPRLEIDLKNTPRLTVRTYKVDSLNLARRWLEIINPRRRGDIPSPDLDGLDLGAMAPADERTIEFTHAPMLRHREVLDFPELAGRRGTWIVECIAGGTTMRAILHKGTISGLAECTAQGLQVTVVDGTGTPIPGAEAWDATRRFVADAQGRILLPFAPTRPEPTPSRAILISDPRTGLAGLAWLKVPERKAALDVSLLVPADPSQQGASAKVVARIDPRINGVPGSLSLSDTLDLRLGFVRDNGLRSSVPLRIPASDGARHVSIPCTWPEGLHSAGLSANAVPAIPDTDGERTPLTSDVRLDIDENHWERTSADVHLQRDGADWVLAFRNRNGDALAGRELVLELQSRATVKPTLERRVATDASGCARLGALPEIACIRVTATHDGGSRTRAFDLEHLAAPADMRPWNDESTGKAPEAPTYRLPAGAPIEIPLRTAQGVFLRRLGVDDRPMAVLSEGVTVTPTSAKLPALPHGRYDLVDGTGFPLVKTLIILPANTVGGWSRLDDTFVRIDRDAPVGLDNWHEGKDTLQLRVINPRPDTRVVVTASAFVTTPLVWKTKPDADSAQVCHAMRLTSDNLYDWRKIPLCPPSTYTDARPLPEESRYILERKRSTPQLGVMLPKPGVLLNPWAVDGKYDFIGCLEGEIGGDGLGSFFGSASGLPRGSTPGRRPASDTPRADFLAEATATWVLAPDASGVVSLPVAELGQRNWITATLLEDSPRDRAICARAMAHPPVADRRQPHEDPATPLAVKREVVTVPPGQPLPAPADAPTTRSRLLRTTADLFDACIPAILGPDFMENGTGDEAGTATLFAIRDWPRLTDARKLEVLRRSPSHELNLFVWAKDRPFFDRAIRPQLAHKRVKGLVDDFLLDRDLEPWTEPVRYRNLNAVERMLLARALPARRETIASALEAEAKAEPDQPQERDERFLSALGDRDSNYEEVVRCEFEVSNNPTPTAPRIPPREDKRDEAEARPAPGPRPEIASVDDTPLFDNPFAHEAPKPAGTPDATDGTTTGTAAGAEEEASTEAKAQDAPPARPAPAAPAPNFRPPHATRELSEATWMRLDGEAAEYNQRKAPRDLFDPKPIWAELARATPGTPVLPSNIVDAASEADLLVVAMALVDLPTKAAPGQPHGGAILLRQEQSRLPLADGAADFRLRRTIHAIDPANPDEPRLVDPARIEAGRTYAMNVVVNNDASFIRDAVMRIPVPEGAIACAPFGFKDASEMPPTNVLMYTDEVLPGDEQSMVVQFFFPRPGTYVAAPATVATGNRLAAATPPVSFTVHPEGSLTDRSDWFSLAAHGTDDEVLAHLATADHTRTNLDPMLWRLADKGFYERCTRLLAGRLWFDKRVAAYASRHGDLATLAQLIRCDKNLCDRIGSLRTAWLEIDPERDGRFEARDYDSLINARFHKLGQVHGIRNEAFRETYANFVCSLLGRDEPTPEQLLLLSTYLLLQERTGEAAGILARVPRDQVAERMQYDYLAAWIALSRCDAATARKLATPYADLASTHWGRRFGTLLAQLDEIESGRPASNDAPAFNQDAAAGLEPTLSAKAEGETLILTVHGGTKPVAATLKWHAMDLEHRFSATPFDLQPDGTRDAMRSDPVLMQPKLTTTQEIPAGASVRIAIPESLRGKCVFVEAGAGDKQATATLVSSGLDVGIAANYGQVAVRDRKTGKPLPRTYVKVYARTPDGTVSFHKDGYTDLRGRFDYAGVSTCPPSTFERFSILVLHDTLGAEVHETPPPAQ